jgi:hypothetical protein
MTTVVLVGIGIDDSCDMASDTEHAEFLTQKSLISFKTDAIGGHRFAF